MQLRLIFKVPSMTRWEVLRSLTRQKAIFFLKEFQGLCGLCRKDNSSQSSGGCLRLFSRDCVGARGKLVPLSGWGIRTSFPHNDLEDGADLNMVCSIGKNSKRDPWRRGIVSHEIPPEEVTRLGSCKATSMNVIVKNDPIPHAQIEERTFYVGGLCEAEESGPERSAYELSAQFDSIKAVRSPRQFSFCLRCPVTHPKRSVLCFLMRNPFDILPA